MLAIVIAADLNGAIGKGGQIPWRCPADMKYFASTTKQGINPTIIMGRITAESLGRALPGRRNIVVTSRDQAPYEGMEIARSLEDAVAMTDAGDSVYVIGGTELVRQAMAISGTRFYFTRIHTVVEDADTWLPPIRSNEWMTIQTTERPPAEDSEYRRTIHVMDRF